jgi:hypothetical protein
MGLAVLAFGDDLGPRETVGAAAIVAGGVALGFAPGPRRSDALGVAAIAAACAAWALDNNLAQRLALRDPVSVAHAKTLAAGVISVALALASDDRLPRLGVALGAPLLRGRGRVRLRERPRHHPVPSRGRRRQVPLADGAAVRGRRRRGDDHAGPVVITVAYVGFVVAGLAGAAAAAVGVFLPCYLMVIIPAPYYRRFAQNKQIRAFVTGVTSAATGAIAGAAIVLGRRAVFDIPTAALFAGTLLVLTKVKRFQSRSSSWPLGSSGCC